MYIVEWISLHSKTGDRSHFTIYRYALGRLVETVISAHYIL